MMGYDCKYKTFKTLRCLRHNVTFQDIGFLEKALFIIFQKSAFENDTENI